MQSKRKFKVSKTGNCPPGSTSILSYLLRPYSPRWRNRGSVICEQHPSQLDWSYAIGHPFPLFLVSSSNIMQTSKPNSLISTFQQELLIPFRIIVCHHPRCFLKASCTVIPFSTSSFTRSSASTRPGSIETSSETFPFGITMTPFTESLKTRSPGFTMVPSRSRGTCVA